MAALNGMLFRCTVTRVAEVIFFRSVSPSRESGLSTVEPTSVTYVTVTGSPRSGRLCSINSFPHSARLANECVCNRVCGVILLAKNLTRARADCGRDDPRGRRVPPETARCVQGFVAKTEAVIRASYELEYQ